MDLQVSGIQHLNLAVRDLDRACRFYEEVLGFRRAFTRGSSVWLEAGRDLLGLSEGEPPPQSSNHFGFRVAEAEAVTRWSEQLSRHGVELEKGPYDRSDGCSLYFRDPDGYLIEILYVDSTAFERA